MSVCCRAHAGPWGQRDGNVWPCMKASSFRQCEAHVAPCMHACSNALCVRRVAFGCACMRAGGGHAHLAKGAAADDAERLEVVRRHALPLQARVVRLAPLQLANYLPLLVVRQFLAHQLFFKGVAPGTGTAGVCGRVQVRTVTTLLPSGGSPAGLRLIVCLRECRVPPPCRANIQMSALTLNAELMARGAERRELRSPPPPTAQNPPYRTRRACAVGPGPCPCHTVPSVALLDVLVLHLVHVFDVALCCLYPAAGLRADGRIVHTAAAGRPAAVRCGHNALSPPPAKRRGRRSKSPAAPSPGPWDITPRWKGWAGRLCVQAACKQLEAALDRTARLRRLQAPHLPPTASLLMLRQPPRCPGGGERGRG